MCVIGVMCEFMPLLIEDPFEHNFFSKKKKKGPSRKWKGFLKLLDALELHDLKGRGDLV